MKYNKMKWLLDGFLGIFEFNKLNTPITNKIKPNIETNDKKALENDINILKTDIKNVFYKNNKNIKGD